jgi:pimeloyl-ACP methyl ester carboxylesterase
MDQDQQSSAKHQHWGRLGRSVLNGVIGDYLEKENNPLAIKMGFYHKLRRLSLDEQLAQQVDFPLTNKIVVFVHGLTNLETVWDYTKQEPPGSLNIVDDYIDDYIDACFDSRGASLNENYGLNLKEEFGFTPLFLRYNTGLSLEKNGRELSKQLNKLVTTYPINIDELMLVGFSMGGLLLRFAQASAAESQSEWHRKLSKCVYIGTPHEGSPLEKIGHITGEIVRQVPRDYINHWADWIDMRSEGIQNLKHGLTFFGGDKSADAVCDSFTEHARHYFISSAVADKSDSLINKVLGDGLVRQSSANPRSAPANCQNAHFEGMSHVNLAHSDRVYQQIKNWLDGEQLGKPSSNKTALQCYNPIRKPYTAENEHDVSTQALMAGTLALLATGYEKTIETVETVHYSIAGEPFSMLQKIPFVSQVADPVESAHKEILDLVYRSLRLGGKVVHKVAKQLAPDDMKPEAALSV